ncbi:hypothetical protein D3C72_1163760 [compost metagenome]
MLDASMSFKVIIKLSGKCILIHASTVFIFQCFQLFYYTGTQKDLNLISDQPQLFRKVLYLFLITDVGIFKFSKV